MDEYCSHYRPNNRLKYWEIEVTFSEEAEDFCVLDSVQTGSGNNSASY
jgi:hypothetical protein